MLGPAELREMDEMLADERTDGARAEKSSPYLTPHFAMGMAVARAAGASAAMKVRFPHFALKR